MKETKGITLIALIVTIIILLILAGVTISALMGENGTVNQAVDAKFKNTLATIEEQINIYKYQKNVENVLGIDAYPIEKENGNKITLKSLVGEENIEDLPGGLKDKLLEVSKPENNEIYGYEDINYDEFYKIDEELIPAAGEYPGKLILYVDTNSDEYRVLHIDGVKYAGEEKFIIIPWDNQEPPVFVTTSRNTYKLQSNGEVKVVGELQTNSGASEEELNQTSGLQKLDLEKFIEEYGIASDPNVETEDEVAKEFGLKKIILNYTTIYIIDAENELWAWGSNIDRNKLGQGNSFSISIPTKILEGKTGSIEGVKAKEIYVAQYNTCVIDTENRVWICGNNEHGGLGQGNFEIYDNYQIIKINGEALDGNNVKKVLMSNSPYSNETIIVLKDGRVFGAGYNSYGEFGIGNTQKQANFIELTSFKNADQIELVDRTTYVRFGNELYACGNNQYANIIGKDGTVVVKTLTKVADDVKKFYVATPYYGAVLYESLDGKIYSLNYVYKDETGKNIYVSQRTAIKKADGSDLLASETQISYTWILVDNHLYQLEINESKDGWKLKSLTNKKVDKIIEGYYGSEPWNISIFSNEEIYLQSRGLITNGDELAIKSFRTIKNNISYIYGVRSSFSMVDRNGYVWENINSPIDDSNVNGQASKIIASQTNRYVLTRDGRIFSKSTNNDGGYGGGWGDLNNHTNYTKMLYSDGTEVSNVKDIFTSAHGYSFIYLTNDNDIYTTGYFYYTLPNINRTTHISRPIKVESNIITQIKDKISYLCYGGKNTGNGVTYIVTTDGELYTIAGDSNLSGNGKVTEDFEKLEIYSGAKIRDIQTYNDLTLAVTQNGEVYGWGYNTYGLLGNEYEINEIYKTPVKLNLPSTIKSVEMGDGFAIFITTTGDVYGIGRNEFGQLGTGDTISTDTFVRCVELEK